MRLIDIGCGSGAGAIAALRSNDAIGEVIFSDINPKALSYSRINCQLAKAINHEFLESDILKNIPTKADIIIANPPYIVDPNARIYRNGGGIWGCDISLRIVQESLDALLPGGKLILYTGTPVVDGVPIFLKQIQSLNFSDSTFIYEEIDPDVFGEELENPYYATVDRIAAVALVVTRSEQ